MNALAAPADSERPVRIRPLLLVVVAIACLPLGWAVADQLAHRDYAVVGATAVYLGLLVTVWWATRGNALVLLLVAYIIAPAPADNLLPQVEIFSDSDYAVRSRDLLFLADVVLIVLLIMLKPTWPTGRWTRWWLLGLGVLAVYPVIVGIWFGTGQSILAITQGALMPLRGLLIVVLTMTWIKMHGWQQTLTHAVRTLVICGVVLALATSTVALIGRGELQLLAFGYPLLVDGRPSIPGWGNNILANYLCVCVAIVVFLRRYLGWSLRWMVAAVALLIVGIAFTEVRIAMMLALLIGQTPIVLAVVRRLWPRRGGVIAVSLGLVAAVILGIATTIVLPIINPRFQTLTPAAITKQLPQPPDQGDPERPSFDPETGKDLGTESTGTRTTLAKAAVGVWLHSPAVGQGWNAWGWAKSDENPRLVVAIDPHNGLLWLLAETGVIGLLLWYAVPIIVARQRWLIWPLWTVLALATVLELVNPNVRNAHFAAAFWVLIAFAMSDALPIDADDRYTIRRWLTDCGQWLKGAPS